MALPPTATNQAFLREVDEELRRDRLATFWERYGRLLLATIGAALVLFAAYLFWADRREKARGVEGEQLQAAFDNLASGKDAAAAAPLDALAKSSSPGMRALARFTRGDVALQHHDEARAAAEFASVADDGSLARPFRDLALVRRTAAEYDRLAPQVVIDRLRGLAVPGTPFFGSAGEMVAVSYLRTGRRDLAGRTFADLARDAQVPASIRQRAVQMAGAMGADAAPAPSAPAAGEGAQ